MSSLLNAIVSASSSTAGGPGSPAQGGTGESGSYTDTGSGITYAVVVSTNGISSPGTAYPGDTITWNVTSSPADVGKTLHWWVDNAIVPAATFVENIDHGTITLNGFGIGSFQLTVVARPPTHNLFRMYFGYSLYAGFLTHGNIGV